MSFPEYLKPRNWINQLKYRWSLLPPTHRLIFLSGVTGAIFVIMLALLLSHTLKEDLPLSHYPSEIGLVAEADLLTNTPVNLLHFSFKKFTHQGHAPCPAYVSLQDADILQNYRLIQPLSRGQYLCWNTIQKMNPEDKPNHLKKTHPTPRIHSG